MLCSQLKQSTGLWILGVFARCYPLPRLFNCLVTIQLQVVQLLFENDELTQDIACKNLAYIFRIERGIEVMMC